MNPLVFVPVVIVITAASVAGIWLAARSTDGRHPLVTGVVIAVGGVIFLAGAVNLIPGWLGSFWYVAGMAIRPADMALLLGALLSGSGIVVMPR